MCWRALPLIGAGAAQRNLALHGKQIYYADDHTPITGFKFFLNFMNEIFYGACPGGAADRRAPRSPLAQGTTFRARTTAAAARSACISGTQARPRCLCRG